MKRDRLSWGAVVGIIIGICLIVAALALGARASTMSNRLRKYEFENRTSGGVVEFPDFEASKAHGRSRAKVSSSQNMAGTLLLIGLAILGFSLLRG